MPRTSDPGPPGDSDDLPSTNSNDVGAQMTEDMADTRRTMPEGSNEELETSSDSDLDDGDEVIARRYPRNHLNLEKHGFRPVWTHLAGYPGEIPADIGEYLDENGQCGSAQMIGPLRSLAWLAGLDELVEAIDHPAYTIRDGIEVVPHGADISFPVNRHWDEGNIPPRIWSKVIGGPVLRRDWRWSWGTTRYQIPACITETPTEFNLRDLFETCRIQPSAGSVECMRIQIDMSTENPASSVSQFRPASGASSQRVAAGELDNSTATRVIENAEANRI